jgi:glucosyl-3-phosphoglycerate synthase
VRREVLERISFPIGYGVETSHLLDIYHQWGIDAFVQTDLDQRVHHNQPTRALGKMAFGILQTFFKRAENMGVFDKLPDYETILRQFQAVDEKYEQVQHNIVEDERPPMITIDAYRKKYKLKEYAKK